MMVTFSHPLVESSVAQPTEGIRPGETLVIDIVTQPGVRVEISFSLSPNRQPKHEHLADYLKQFGALVSSSPEKYAESVIESFRKDFPDEELPFGDWDNGICIADERGYCQYSWLLGTADYLMDPNPDDDRPGNVEIIIHFSIDNVGRTHTEYIAVLGTPDLSLVDIDLCDIGLCAATAQPAPIPTPSSALTPTPAPPVTPTVTATVTPIATTTVVPTPVAISVVGSCATSIENAKWSVTWREINLDGTYSDVLATETLSATFDNDWGYGVVIDGYDTGVSFNGVMDIAVTRRGPVSFTVGGDDGYRLSITGNGLISEEIINDWNAGSYRKKEVVMNLEPGIYRLNLDYFELTGAARLNFDTNSNVVGWRSIGDCTGDVNVAPSGLYTVLETDAPLADAAERFQVGVNELLVADYSDAPDWVLIPGPYSPPPPLSRKIIVIQGVDSFATWDGDSISIQPDSLSSKVSTIVAAIQSNVWDINSGRDSKDHLVASIDPQDVITFSYSGIYYDTIAGEIGLVENHSGTSRNFALYREVHTCLGVAAGAAELDRLIKRLVDLDPDVEIDLVAHSMGGLIAAYLLATSDAEHVSHVVKVITLDSPLQGTNLVTGLGVIDAFGLKDSECFDSEKEISQAHSDLLPESEVVNVIATLGQTSNALKFHSIKSVPELVAVGVGAPLPGEPVWVIQCALLSPGTAHSCVWGDDQVLLAISRAINLDVSVVPRLLWANEAGDLLLEVDRGEIVTLTASFGGAIDSGVPVNIYEVDPNDFDDLIATVPMIVSNGVGMATWPAEWMLDGLFGSEGNPEYKFVVFDTDSPLLIVR